MFRYVFILVFLGCFNVEDSTLSILQHGNTPYCVLSNDTSKTAITWDFDSETVSYEYYNITELGGIEGKKWKLENSLESKFEVEPILDYRWERLPLIMSCRHELPKTENYKMSVSVLETNTVHLCETKDNEQCYTIIFGENGPNSYTNFTNVKEHCYNYNATYRKKDWLHFTVTYKNNVFTVKCHRCKETITLQHVFHPKFLVIGGRWKLHSYNIYSLRNSITMKLAIGSEEICLGLLIKSPAVNDTITLTLLSDANRSLANATSTMINNKWEELILCRGITPNTTVTLRITSKFQRSKKKQFYIADIIRKINKDGRIQNDIRMKTMKEHKENRCCYAIATSTRVCSDDLREFRASRESKDGCSNIFIVTTQNESQLNVSLDKRECNVTDRSVLYVICLLCISDWCSPNNSYCMNSTENMTYFTVLGHTNYTVSVEVPDGISNTRPEKTFETSPTAPNSVRNITVYRTTNTSVDLRWLEPSPPTGLLDVYILTVSSVIHNINAGTSFCQIWTNYICFEVRNLTPNVNYTLHVYAKNKNTELGPPATVSAKTENKVPAPPEDLNYFWNETTNALTLKWKYPNIPIGNITSFRFEINDNAFSIGEEQNEYSYEVKYEKLNVSSSTDIRLRMFSYNQYTQMYSKEADLDIAVPPKTPKFAKDPIVVNVTRTSIKLRLSKVMDSEGDNSTLYIIISDRPSNAKNGHAISEDDATKMLEEAKADVLSWNANSTENLTEITQQLESGTMYQITFLLHNQYKNISRYFAYTLNVNTSSVTDYKLYLLLVVVPVIGLLIFILYKWRRSKSEVSARFAKQLFLEEHTYEELDSQLENLNNCKVSFEFNIKQAVEMYRRLQGLSVEDSKYSNRIKLQDLQDYVKTCLEKEEIEKQYGMFQMGQTQEWQCGRQPENQSKNRYKNIVAYDRTRVILNIINNDPCSDYINANYIDGFNTKKAYIATQGPKQNTIDDFWRMIWQENVEHIIMIANIIEGGKKKVEQYWPNINETNTYGDISVTFSERLVFAEYESRTFKVTNQRQERSVLHLHFTCWPDHGIPFYPQSLAPFLKRIESIPSGRSPIVVHCSAGVGRTGTLILCDISLRMAANTGCVDLSYHLHKLREQRINMVDNINQYKLAYLALLHCLVEPDFTIQCTEKMETEVNKIIVPKRISEQMKFIDETFWQDEAMLNVSAKITEPVVQEKNRFSKILPDCYSRLALIPDPPSDESSKYINAIKVDGFCELSKFIVTQYPLSNTVKDFWRLVDQNEVSIIICLNTLDLSDKTCCKFYPNLKESTQPTPYMDIECTDVAKETYYNIITFTMRNKQQERTIKIIRVNNWKYSMLHPETPAGLLMTYEEMNSLGRTSNTILVTCLDGCRASGLYTSLCCLIDKIKTEQVCDVCLAVRTVRHSRTEFVREAEQFSFLYKCGLDYVQQFEMYSNFCSSKSKH